MRSPSLQVRGLLLLVCAWVLSACSASASDARVSLDEGRALLESGQVLVFDIREPTEHATGVAAGTQLLPMSQLNGRISEIPQDPDQPVLLICKTQNRSARVVDALREAGWTNVRFIEGGMSDWARRGWPMVAPVY
jgi:rhodanese-related sulfurtransferase